MIKFRAVCPQCRGKFPWDPAAGLPSRCPLPKCDYESPERDDDVIYMPSLRSARMAQTDGTYRELERSSEARAQMAADAAGVPVSEMAHLKVTNIKDNCKPGEVAAIPVVNDITRQMDFIKSRGGQVGFGAGTNGAEYAAGTAQGVVTVNGQVMTGIVPRAGATAMANVQRMLGRR